MFPYLSFCTAYSFFIFITLKSYNGERAQGKKDLLQRKEVLQAHHPQSHPVQVGQGLQLCTGEYYSIKELSCLIKPSIKNVSQFHDLSSTYIFLTLFFLLIDLPHIIINIFSRPQGKRRYDSKQMGFGGQTKPIFHKKVCIRFTFSNRPSYQSCFIFQIKQ